MAKSGKTPRVKHFRISLIDDMTHKQLWVMRLSRTSLFVLTISIVTVMLAVSFSIVAFTPVRTFIPGYPNAHTKKAAIDNALKIDSLQTVIYTWKFYSENLRRIVSGQEPIPIDSLIGDYANSTDEAVSKESLEGQDSILRESVRKAEQFGLSKAGKRRLPIEGMHFFTPLKGVVSQGYDPLLHPYIDITAPANSVVMSVLDGTVINAGWSDDSGYTIQIQHSDDIVSIYKHNQKLLKKTGDKVTAGTPIALVGNTGALTTGDHLHFELWYKGEAVNPTEYISF